jgi:hypothetical protein
MQKAMDLFPNPDTVAPSTLIWLCPSQSAWFGQIPWVGNAASSSGLLYNGEAGFAEDLRLQSQLTPSSDQIALPSVEVITPSVDKCPEITCRLSNEWNHGLRKLHESLDFLNSNLCEQLYQPSTICLPDDTADVDKVAPGLDCPSMSFRECEYLESDCVDLDNGMYMNYLSDTATTIMKCLDYLDSASILAARFESSSGVELANLDQEADEFLDECYYRFDPSGIEERRQEDESYEHDERETRVNFAGHLFTFDRGQFWKRFTDMNGDLKQSFVRFGLAHPVTQSSCLLTFSQYECACHGLDPQAHFWQEMHSDTDDEDDLMQLLRLLREIKR